MVLHYGKEQLYGVDCNALGSSPCQLQVGKTITETTSHGFKFDVTAGVEPEKSPAKAAFNFGASWEWSSAIANTVNQIHTFTPNNSDPYPARCGHWSFIPYLIESCGTFSEASVYEPNTCGWVNPNAKFNTCPNVKYCRKSKDVKQTKNYCNILTVKAPNSNVGVQDGGNGGSWGKTIFVKKECKSQKIFVDGQEAVYVYPGVSREDNYKGNPATVAQEGNGIKVGG